MELKNKNIVLSVNESDGTVRLFDTRRDAAWTLDCKTMLCDGKPLIYESAYAEDGRIFVRYNRATYAYTVYDDHIGTDLLSDTADDSIRKITMPSSFTASSGNCRYLLPIMQGMLWNCDGGPFESFRGEAGHHGFSMPMFAVLAGRGGYIYIAETMDDCHWTVGKDEDGRTWCCNIQTASLGNMRYNRKSRIYFTDAGITPAAKQYRRYVQGCGRFVTFREKMRSRPALANLFGALMCYIGYCQDDIDYVENLRRLKNYGFNKALVYPVRFNTYSQDFLMGGAPPIDLSDTEIAEIKSLGYDVAPWTWINEAVDDGSDEIRAMHRKSESGNSRLSWQIDEFKYYNICTAFMEDFYRRQRQGRFGEMTWDHFDVITCATNNECYAGNHPSHPNRPLSKSEDRLYLRRLLSAAGEAGGAVSSESFNDAYSLEYDIGSVKAWAQYDNFLFKPVPLTMLVYHDSMIHSWWEVHNYNSNYFGRCDLPFYQYGGGAYELQAAMDALYGCPPDVFPFGAQYCWTGKGSQTMLYKFRFDDPETQHALKLALPVARSHEDIGMLEMTDFAFLSDDYNMQRTVFENGVRIYANFSLNIKYHDECGCMLPRSWRRIDK